MLAAGRMVEVASKAAGQLAESGVSATVVNARWIKPLDARLENWAASHRVVVTLEDNVLSGGFGAGVMERLAPSGMAGKVRPFAVPDEFLRFGNADSILCDLGLDAASVASASLRLVEGGT